MLAFMLALGPGFALAQHIGGTGSGSSQGVAVKRAAVIETFFRDGEEADNKTACKAVTDEIDSVLGKCAIEEVPTADTNAAWQQACGESFDEKNDALPDPQKLVAVGNKLGVDYVIFLRTQWHVRSVWVGLGPKTKADARTDLWIVDVKKSEFALRKEDVKAGDNDKDSALGIGLDLFVAPVTFFSGGPETPHMARAGQLATIKAIGPWAEDQHTQINKIG